MRRRPRRSMLALFAPGALVLALTLSLGAAPPPPRVLLTGFEPFNRRKLNASWEGVRRLEDAVIAGHDVHVRRLPVDYRKLWKLIPSLLKEHDPAAVIHFGVAGTGALRFERVARNRISNLRDAAGYHPKARRIAPDGPLLYRSRLPETPIIQGLKGSGVRVVASEDALSWICEYSFYVELYFQDKLKKTAAAGLIHVPRLGRPLSSHQLSRAMEGIARATLKARATQKRRAAGKPMALRLPGPALFAGPTDDGAPPEALIAARLRQRWDGAKDEAPAWMVEEARRRAAVDLIVDRALDEAGAWPAEAAVAALWREEAARARSRGLSLETCLRARGESPASRRRDLARELGLDALLGPASEAERAEARRRWRDALSGRRVRLAHALFASRDEAAEARGRALSDQGFSRVALASLEEESAGRGGELGWLRRWDDLPEPLAAAAFALAPGETSAPIKGEAGWHLLRVLDEDFGGPKVRASALEARLRRWRRRGWTRERQGSRPPSSPRRWAPGPR